MRSILHFKLNMMVLNYYSKTNISLKLDTMSLLEVRSLRSKINEVNVLTLHQTRAIVLCPSTVH